MRRHREARPGDDGPAPLIPDDALHHERPSRRHAVKVLAIGLLAWGVPVGLVAALTGRDSVFTEQGLFFSGAALVTFGGAYAVLAYVAQKAVEVYGWLAPGEMVRGLALAESTPGPLIMVVQFVAFVGAYRDPGSLDPWVAAVLAALLTTWVTFVPCFVFIFLGAPYVERLRGNRRALGRPDRDHRRRRRRDRQPGGLLRPPHAVRRHHDASAGARDARGARARHGAPVRSRSWRSPPYCCSACGGRVLRTLGVCAVLGLLASLAGLPVT